MNDMAWITFGINFILLIICVVSWRMAFKAWKRAEYEHEKVLEILEEAEAVMLNDPKEKMK